MSDPEATLCSDDARTVAGEVRDAQEAERL
jgi:hypothetical protein